MSLKTHIELGNIKMTRDIETMRKRESLLSSEINEFELFLVDEKGFREKMESDAADVCAPENEVSRLLNLSHLFKCEGC